MSRIGKKVHVLPQGVAAVMNGEVLSIKGPKGELTLKIHPRVSVIINGAELTVNVARQNDGGERALWGTFSSLIGGMIEGVSQGFKKQLEVNGVGFKVGLKGADLHLEVGFSHPVDFKAPEGIKFTVEKNVITVEGIDKQLVGETAAQIRKIKKPEPYQGKGIKYVDEVIRRKAGKTAAKSA
jgi:large subunit ribosomal protein L6